MFLGWQCFLELLFDDGGKLTRCAWLKAFDDFGPDPDLDLAAATWFAPCTWSRSPSSRSRFLFPFLHLSGSCDCEIRLTGGRLRPAHRYSVNLVTHRIFAALA